MTEFSCISLYASFTKKRLISFIRDTCTQEEIDNMGLAFQKWQDASKIFHQIKEKEKGIADNCEISEIESQLVYAIKSHPMINLTFSNEVTDFKMVDIENVIATQTEVVLDYVDELKTELPMPPSDERLLKFCLIPEKKVPKPKMRRKNANTYYFSSPSRDFRFLGGFLRKELSREEVLETKVGGFPTNAITLFVGYGSFCMTAFQVGGRIILENGFHRAYTLEKHGVKKIPMLLIKRSESEFPDQLREFKKDYLLHNPRPILMKDFLNDELIREFSQKETRTILKLSWDTDRTIMDF